MHLRRKRVDDTYQKSTRCNPRISDSFRRNIRSTCRCNVRGGSYIVTHAGSRAGQSLMHIWAAARRLSLDEVGVQQRVEHEQPTIDRVAASANGSPAKPNAAAWQRSSHCVQRPLQSGCPPPARLLAAPAANGEEDGYGGDGDGDDPIRRPGGAAERFQGNRRAASV